MKIRLSDEDRERLSCPEVIDCGIETVTVREAIAIEEATGLKSSDALALMQPEYAPSEAGGIKGRYTPQGMLLRAWLGLRRAGVEVAYADLDFDLDAFPAGWLPVRESAKEPEGKAPRSPKGGRSTASKSARSGRRTSSPISTS